MEADIDYLSKQSALLEQLGAQLALIASAIASFSGAVAGAGIPEHLHYHVIPRWTGDLNFFPLIAETKVLVESLEQTYEKVWSILRKYE